MLTMAAPWWTLWAASQSATAFASYDSSASAAISRIYRLKFQRDIYKDLSALKRAVGKEDEGNSNLDLFSLKMFENIAYVMAKHADRSIPDTPEEWLDGFGTFSIYQVLPKLIELRGLNVRTGAEAKKLRPTDWPMTTPLFLLRCVQLEAFFPGSGSAYYRDGE